MKRMRSGAGHRLAVLVLALGTLIAVTPVFGGGNNGSDPVPTFTYGEFAAQAWMPDGTTFNCVLFGQAIGIVVNGTNGPDPVPTFILDLVEAGLAPAFYSRSWSGWQSMDENGWVLLCRWAAAAAQGAQPVFPSQLPR